MTTMTMIATLANSYSVHLANISIYDESEHPFVKCSLLSRNDIFRDEKAVMVKKSEKGETVERGRAMAKSSQRFSFMELKLDTRLLKIFIVIRFVYVFLLVKSNVYGVPGSLLSSFRGSILSSAKYFLFICMPRLRCDGNTKTRVLRV